MGCYIRLLVQSKGQKPAKETYGELQERLQSLRRGSFVEGEDAGKVDQQLGDYLEANQDMCMAQYSFNAAKQHVHRLGQGQYGIQFQMNRNQEKACIANVMHNIAKARREAALEDERRRRMRGLNHWDEIRF